MGASPRLKNYNPPMMRIAALVGPSLVLGLCGAWLGWPEVWTADAEVQAQIDLLAKASPELVLIGNSLTLTDVDYLALGKALGMSAAAIKENGSPGPTWYAMLKYRVFEAGHRPKLVLMVSTLSHMLTAKPENAEGMMRLQHHFGSPDEALQRKVFGAEGSALWLRVKDRRTRLKEAIMDGLKERAAGAEADRALEVLFDASNLTGERADGVLPVAAAEEAAKVEEATGPEGSFIPEILALAAANGARVVFVRVPVAPSAVRDDDVHADVEAATIRLINEAGGGWLDMRGLPVTEGHFRDTKHMNAQGQRLMTAALAERLKELGALGEAPMRAAALPLRPAVLERRGVAPEFALKTRVTEAPCGQSAGLPELGFLSDVSLGAAGTEARSPLVLLEDGAALPRSQQRADLGPECRGAFSHFANGLRFSSTPGRMGASYRAALNPEFPLRQGSNSLWWLYPGTDIVAGFAERWDRGAFSVRVEGLRLGPGTGEIRLSLVEGGRERAGVALTGEGDSLQGVLEAPAPRGPYEIHVAAPADAPWLLLRRLRFGDSRDPSTALLTPTPKVIPLHTSPLRCGAPPPLGLTGAPHRGQGPADLPTPDLGFLSVDALADLTGARRNSPVQLLEDGAPLPEGNAPLDEARKGKPGSYVHQIAGFLFTPPDGSDPVTNGRSYTVRLDPERRTMHGRWLYPGDACAMDIDPKKIRKPVRSLLLSGGTTGPVPEGERMTVRLLAGERVLVEETVDWSRAREGLEWPLAENQKEPLVLELATSAGMPYVFLKLLSVADSVVGG